jgi:hypothetical protein
MRGFVGLHEKPGDNERHQVGPGSPSRENRFSIVLRSQLFAGSA